MDGKRTVLSGLLLTGLALVVLIGGALAPQSALAATLYISEFASPAGQVGTVSAVGVFPQPAIADQAVTFTTTTQSAAFNAGTHAVLLSCDAACSIRFGTSPTATTSNFKLAANVPIAFVVVPGQKVAVVTNP